MKVDGKEIQDDQFYTMGGCEREGEELDIICRLKGVHDTRYVPGTIHQALEEYVARHSPLNYPRQGRVRADDLPDHVWSQYGMLQKMWDLPGSDKGVEIPPAPPANTR